MLKSKIRLRKLSDKNNQMRAKAKLMTNWMRVWTLKVSLMISVRKTRSQRFKRMSKPLFPSTL
jgi:hypothetical protein